MIYKRLDCAVECTDDWTTNSPDNSLLPSWMSLAPGNVTPTHERSMDIPIYSGTLGPRQSVQIKPYITPDDC